MAAADGTPGSAAGSAGWFIEQSSPELSWRPDEFERDQGYQEYMEELRSLIFETAQSTAPTREASPAPIEPFHGDATSDLHTVQETDGILRVGKRVSYLRNYVDQVAPWLDMFDSDRTFGMRVTALANTCPALLYAVLALSARQIERVERRKAAFDSLELYQEAIHHLTPMLQAREPSIIPICVVLCCLEMMSASADDWRRHLEGCAALFSAFGVNGFSGGLLQAVFWCYARMDLCGALISDGSQITLVPPAKWLSVGARPGDARGLFASTGCPDMHANYAVWLCARACELIADRNLYLELGEPNGCDGAAFEGRWLTLWLELQRWLDDRPTGFRPVRSTDATPFPRIFFAHWASISANQLYHTACLLMLGVVPRSLKLRLSLGVSGTTVWHAKRICGISATNPHPGCLNNAIQPLWLAGRLLSHASEHQAIVKLIRSIESVTGWGSSWRIADLAAAWGYRVARNGELEALP